MASTINYLVQDETSHVVVQEVLAIYDEYDTLGQR